MGLGDRRPKNRTDYLIKDGLCACLVENKFYLIHWDASMYM